MKFFQKIKLLRQIKKHIGRPLDIREILARQTDANVVVDAYEFFMRKYHWDIRECGSECIQTFLLCVLYDGEIGNGGISQFLASSSGDHAHQTADALHTIGALEAETLLRKSFDYFADKIVPEDEAEQNRLLDEIGKTDGFNALDAAAYQTDISVFCYQYLMNNKAHFLANG